MHKAAVWCSDKIIVSNFYKNIDMERTLEEDVWPTSVMQARV